jgi:hypothetical protein
MGTNGKVGQYLEGSYWKSLSNANSRSGAMVGAFASTINDTLNGRMRNYFMKTAAVTGEDWRGAMRNAGLR